MLYQYVIQTIAVGDPGFPVGGASTSKGWGTNSRVVRFRKFCMSKQKNLDPWGGRAPGAIHRSANSLTHMSW